MNLELLREQLQENLISYMDTVQPQYLEIDRQWVYDDLCQVVIDTFDDAFYAPKPIDNSPQDVVECLDCGETPPCYCEAVR